MLHSVVRCARLRHRQQGPRLLGAESGQHASHNPAFQFVSYFTCLSINPCLELRCCVNALQEVAAPRSRALACSLASFCCQLTLKNPSIADLTPFPAGMEQAALQGGVAAAAASPDSADGVDCGGAGQHLPSARQHGRQQSAQSDCFGAASD